MERNDKGHMYDKGAIQMCVYSSLFGESMK